MGTPYLERIEFWENGTFVGPEIVFYSTGQLSYTTTDVGKNVDFMDEDISYVGKSSEIPYQGYCKGYDENGRLESEGWFIFGEDFIIDVYYVGEWKYYAPDGTIKTRIQSTPNNQILP